MRKVSGIEKVMHNMVPKKAKDSLYPENFGRAFSLRISWPYTCCSAQWTCDSVHSCFDAAAAVLFTSFNFTLQLSFTHCLFIHATNSSTAHHSFEQTCENNRQRSVFMNEEHNSTCTYSRRRSPSNVLQNYKNVICHFTITHMI